MVREKKAASAIKAPSRAKPTTQSDTDDPPSFTDNQRKSKATGGQRRKPSGTQRSLKKPAPRSRHNTTDRDVNGDGTDEEGDGEENNNRNDGNDPVEANHLEENDNPGADVDEENGNPENNEEQAHAKEVNNDQEEAYKQAEIKLLKAKMKLLLIDTMKKKPGNLDAQVAKSERRLKSEVRELRERLAEGTEEPEPATGGKKGQSGRNNKKKDDPRKKGKYNPSKKLWAIHGIIKETTYNYLVVWKGEDEHGQPWDDSWVAKRQVNAAAKHDWAALRASEAKDRKEKHKELEEKLKSDGGQGQDQSEDEDEDDEDKDDDEDAVE